MSVIQFVPRWDVFRGPRLRARQRFVAAVFSLQLEAGETEQRRKTAAGSSLRFLLPAGCPRLQTAAAQ